MKELKIFSYIKKYRLLIIIVSLAMGFMFYWYFSGRQVYTARAIIQYTNADAVNGLAPDGTEIDTSEIYSSEVMTRVFQEMDMSYDENNMDAIRASVSVEPVLSDEEQAVQEALNEQGEVAEEKPTIYQVSYSVRKGDVSNGKEFATKLLTTMLNVYLEVYAENHVNSSVPANSVSGIYDTDYDYIEMIELIDDSVGSIMENLGYKQDLQFRSSDTGYSFSDLEGEFSLLQEIDISDIYAYILENKITKDQDILLSKYENRIKNYRLNNSASQSEIDGIDEIINSYVSMMRESGNTDFTYEYILGDVYDNYRSSTTSGELESGDSTENIYGDVDVTTEYDNLMNGYVDEQTTFEETLIDISYAQYILDIYSGNEDTSGNVSVKIINDPAETVTASDSDADNLKNSEEESADDSEEEVSDGETDITSGTETKDRILSFDTDTVKKETIVSTQEEQDQAYQMIETLADKIDVLYERVVSTNQEYNQFAGAENISILTDTATTESINLLLYAGLSVVLFGFAGCVLVVIFGRVSEIFEYYVYVDKKFNIANRAGCDRYISKTDKKMLTEESNCVYFKMLDIETKNRMNGREQCDRMLKDFCSILQTVFPEEQSFVAANGPGQFVVFVNEIERDLVYAYVKEIGRQCMDYNKEKICKISYVCGISSSSVDEIYNLRKLMIDAIRKASGALK